jgi:hypothetical protein
VNRKGLRGDAQGLRGNAQGLRGNAQGLRGNAQGLRVNRKTCFESKKTGFPDALCFYIGASAPLWEEFGGTSSPKPPTSATCAAPVRLRIPLRRCFRAGNAVKKEKPSEVCPILRRL